MMMALTLVVIPSCENNEELDIQVQGLAQVTGTYVGAIDNATQNGLATVTDEAKVKVQAFVDNTLDITFPKLQYGSITIDDLVFTEIAVSEDENNVGVWRFSNDGEIVVNASVVRAKISGSITSTTNQLSVNISISEDVGTLIFKGVK